MNPFEQICADADIWIIKYVSSGFAVPVFLIWYTDVDEDRTDKLMTFNTGEIFATITLEDIEQTIEKNLGSINQLEKLKSWMSCFGNIEPIEASLYSTKCFENISDNTSLGILQIENILNFINLFGDFVYQDEKNKYLKPLLKNAFVQHIWDYYYNYIFWPRFNDAKKFESMERPMLDIDKNKLSESLSNLESTLNSKIKLAKLDF